MRQLLLSLCALAGAGGSALSLVGCQLPAAQPEQSSPREVSQNAVSSESLWWQDAVFYEIFVRSFADSSEGKLASDGVGDLRGLVERLDYLNDGDPSTEDDLGIDALWLMPVSQSPSYHGYDVVDHYRIEKDYGSNADFHRLIDEAHRRGIRVVVDLVLNHTSNRHPWFLEAWRRRSPLHDYYLWAYEKHGYRGPWGQPVWHQLEWWQRGWRHFDYYAYYGIFSPRMPDLNHRNDEVREALFDVARFWLEEMGVDGFRLDAVRHLIEDGAVQQDTPATHAWLRDFHRYVHDIAPRSVLIGEVWAETSAIAAYGADELDLAFQFALAEETVAAVRSGDAIRLGWERQAVRRAFHGRPYATFLTNHDQVRVMSGLEGDLARAKLAATLLLTSPGVPFLYYGEEIGMVGNKPDPMIRKPMQWTAGKHAGFSRRGPWLEPNPDYRSVNVAAQIDDGNSLLGHYRRLLRLRDAHPALRRGDLTAVATSHSAVDAFLRSAPSERILVLTNLSSQPISDYKLSFTGSWPTTGLPDDLLLGSLQPVEAPPVNGGYRPLPQLAPLSAHLLRWPTARGETPAD
jgi:glycosidase